MIKGLVAVLCLILLGPQVLSQEEGIGLGGGFVTKAVFDLDSAGNAEMEINEPLLEDFDYVDVRISADKNNILKIVGSLVDSELVLEPDFTISMSGDEDSGQMTFEIDGGGYSNPSLDSGNFELDMKFSDLAGVLDIEVSGYLDREVLEKEMLVDVDQLASESDMLRITLEEMLNLALSGISAPSPTFTITQLDIQAGVVVDFSAKMQIQNWREMYSQLLSGSYQEAGEELSFLYCLGLSPESISQSIMESQLGVMDMRIQGLPDKIVVGMSMSGSNFLGGGSLSIKDMDFSAMKAGDRIDLSGQAEVEDLRTLVSCLLETYLEGDYTVEDLSLVLSKEPESMGTTRLEGNINGFAKKSGQKWIVSVSRDMAESTEVTVNIPGGMKISSAVGAVVEGSSAKATGEEDMKIVYGEEKPVFGDNLWIILTVIVFLLAFFFLRGRKR
ncbi:MAG: hypothetical protein JXB14_05775 [Candidatus Altiarchaeota archaeon]|nr:hypothetical protein [Candidatus Altiarchaeota archaeon]